MAESGGFLVLTGASEDEVGEGVSFITTYANIKKQQLKRVDLLVYSSPKQIGGELMSVLSEGGFWDVFYVGHGDEEGRWRGLYSPEQFHADVDKLAQTLRGVMTPFWVTVASFCCGGDRWFDVFEANRWNTTDLRCMPMRTCRLQSPVNGALVLEWMYAQDSDLAVIVLYEAACACDITFSVALSAETFFICIIEFYEGRGIILPIEPFPENLRQLRDQYISKKDFADFRAGNRFLPLLVNAAAFPVALNRLRQQFKGLFKAIPGYLTITGSSVLGYSWLDKKSSGGRFFGDHSDLDWGVASPAVAILHKEKYNLANKFYLTDDEVISTTNKGEVLKGPRFFALLREFSQAVVPAVMLQRKKSNWKFFLQTSLDPASSDMWTFAKERNWPFTLVWDLQGSPEEVQPLVMGRWFDVALMAECVSDDVNVKINGYNFLYLFDKLECLDKFKHEAKLLEENERAKKTAAQTIAPIPKKMTQGEIKKLRKLQQQSK